MVFLEPASTPFDLRWRMFGVPIRVHPMFWLMSAVLGWGVLRDAEHGLRLLLLWVGCVFVSILLHELGHVFMGRLFGARGHIILYSFGGLAVGSSNLRSRWQRIAVFFAGPLVQLILWVVLRWIVVPNVPGLRGDDANLYLWTGLGMMLQINLFWPLLNLLPIWPLDGGKISREILSWILPRRGVEAALALSIVVCVLIALNSLSAMQGGPHLPYFGGGTYTILFFGLLGYNNFQEWQQERAAARRGFDPRRPWQQDPDYGRD